MSKFSFNLNANLRNDANWKLGAVFWVTLYSILKELLGCAESTTPVGTKNKLNWPCAALCFDLLEPGPR